MSRIESRPDLPKNLGRRGNVETGGSKKEIEGSLQGSGVHVSKWARDLLESEVFKVAEQKETVELVTLTVAELGLQDGATTQKVFQAAKDLGLELCPAEVGPRLRLKEDIEQSLGEFLIVAMEAIADSGSSRVFCINRRDSGPWLDALNASPRARWPWTSRFVFCRPKKPAVT